MLILALAPPLVLIAAGILLSLDRRRRGAIAATALAAGLALLVLVGLIAADHAFGALYGMADSLLVVVGLPLLVYVAVLAVLARRDGLPAVRVAAVGAAGAAGLWWLGGFAAMKTAP